MLWELEGALEPIIAMGSRAFGLIGRRPLGGTLERGGKKREKED